VKLAANNQLRDLSSQHLYTIKEYVYMFFIGFGFTNVILSPPCLIPKFGVLGGKWSYASDF